MGEVWLKEMTAAGLSDGVRAAIETFPLAPNLPWGGWGALRSGKPSTIETRLVVARRNKRTPVLVAVHGSGYIEVFAEKNVDVKIESVPHCPGSESLAEDVFEQMLKPRYRSLYFPGKMRASAKVRPLRPSMLVRSLATRKIMRGLNP